MPAVAPFLFGISVAAALPFHRARHDVAPAAPVSEARRTLARLLAALPFVGVAAAYAVLVASSTDEAEAIAVMEEVSQRYEDVYLSPLSSGALRYYQVRLGPFHSRDEAARRAQEVARTGMQALIVGEADYRAER